MNKKEAEKLFKPGNIIKMIDADKKMIIYKIRSYEYPLLKVILLYPVHKEYLIEIKNDGLFFEKSSFKKISEEEAMAFII